jgi:hypothetical protein
VCNNWCGFLFSIAPGSPGESRQLFTDADVCRKEKKLEFKDIPMYFSGLCLGTDRRNQIGLEY